MGPSTWLRQLNCWVESFLTVTHVGLSPNGNKQYAQINPMSPECGVLEELNMQLFCSILNVCPHLSQFLKRPCCLGERIRWADLGNDRVQLLPFIPTWTSVGSHSVDIYTLVTSQTAVILVCSMDLLSHSDVAGRFSEVCKFGDGIVA